MTSLSQQLRKLAVPQTSAIVDLKKRPSILFDPKDAAVKDRKTIFNLGYQGLQELIALRQSFAQFERTLFQQTTLHLERSVENSAFNVQLDADIETFFYHLSPYFMTRSAHMCLEWLIRRFQVHEFNKDSFIRLILPYHETNIFVKCVQIMKLNDPSDVWHWLSFIQKSGVPLSKRDIINRAANERFLLSFVCTSVMEAISELGGNLLCLINFYCSVLIGVLDSCGQIKEWQVSTILPSIIKGMKSTVIDYISASFMITSVLINKTKANKKLLNVLVIQICEVNCEQLQTAQILLLSLIYKTGQLTEFPNKGFVDFISNKSLITTLSNLDTKCISMDHVVPPLFSTSLNIIQQNAGHAKMCQAFIENFLKEIKLSNPSARLIITLILQSFSLDKEKNNSHDINVIDLEMGDEAWIYNIIQLLERQYPSVFDAVIKETLLNNDGLFLRNVLSVVFRHKNIDENVSSIIQRLYHPNAEIRATSIKDIASQHNESKIKCAEYGILKEALSELLKDDRVEVIQEILNLTTEVLVENVGCGPFTESLIDIINKATIYPDTWGQLQLVALNHLTADIIATNYDNNLLSLVLVRYLIPTRFDEKWDQYVQIIFGSSFGKRSALLQELKKSFKDIDMQFDDFKKKCLDHLTASNNTPRPDDLVVSIQKSGYNFFKTSINVSHFLIMVTAGFKTNNQPETSRNILTFTLSQCNCFKISQFSENQWICGKNNNVIPLQLFMDFLQRLIETTNFSNFLNWESNTTSLALFLDIMSLITSKAFNTQLTQNEKQQWAMYLKDILDIFFPNLNYKVNVLSQFFIYENFELIENYLELRIRALKVLGMILKRAGKNVQLDLELVLKVIVGLSSPHCCIRQCSLNVLQTLHTLAGPQHIQLFIGNILKKSESVLYDSEQISFLLYSLLNSTSKKGMADELLQQILNLFKESSESFVLRSKIFEILKHIKTTNVLKVAIQLSTNVLDRLDTNNCVTLLDRTTSAIFEATIMRFDKNCIKEVITNNENAWPLIEKSFKMTNAFITLSGKLIPISCVTLDIFDEPIYNQLPLLYKTKLLKLIIEMISNSNNDVLFLEINRALRRCTIDCEQLLPLLDGMKKICLNEKGKCSETISRNIKFTSSTQWKEGIALLEILENKKKLLNSEILIPILFDILKNCLDVENQSPLEYTKQLILSSILQSCKCVNSQKLLENIPNNIRIDLIVQCIRMTQNPETQFKALSLLTYCAAIFPQQVLYNSLEIFTFIGSSIARHDDAFSFQVVSNVLESIVPILVESKSKAITFDLVMPVLKVFSDILLDVPEHRRIPLYSKLLHTLGAETYFWIFLCVIFESLTINEEKNSQRLERNQELPISIISSPHSSEKFPRKVEIALNLLHEFNVNTALQTCISLMTYVKTLPVRKEDAICNDEELQYTELFDIKTKSSKQLRHYRYLILQFVSILTSSPQFLKAATVGDENDKKSTKDLYKNLMIKILSYIPDITDANKKRKDSTHLKYWGVLLDHCYDSLDNIISLLSPDMFLVVVCGLMGHTLATVRKEVLRLLVNKIQEKSDYFLKCSPENISNLLHSLHDLINTILMNNSLDNSIQYNTIETVMVQQAGLIATKLLSKLFGMEYKDDFMNIVLLLTNIIKKGPRVSKIIFATVVLTLVEVISNLKANAISYLPKCIPHLIDALRDQATIVQKPSADNVCLVLLTGIQKLVETVPLFLGPYIVDIISVLSKIWSKIQKNPSEFQHRKQQINNLRLIWSKIAAEIPSRILIPSCETAYYTLMKDQSFLSVGLVMNLLLECLSNLKNSDLLSLQSELTNFFLKSLEFRSEIDEFSNLSILPDDVSKIEMEIINAFVAWVLKLSESSFRPVYKKIYDWAILSNGPKGRVLTYFILNNQISDSLKSIFALFAGDLVLDTADFLNACNTNKSKDLFFLESDNLNIEMLKNMLSTLNKVFKHGRKGFIDPQKFESLIPPIVDQLENNLVLNSDELQNVLSECIGHMATSVSNYVLWKSLNYHILLKTRSDQSQTRIIAFNCCVQMARALGDDFASLLPEIVPFIAELFEDENPQVVKNSRKAVQEIESILNEPLQKYL